MPRVLPASPSLEHLRNQARDLLNAYRAQNPEATVRIEAQIQHLPSPANDPARRFSLADALLVIAREHGFPSWPKLKVHVESVRSTGEIPVAAPIEAPGSPEPRLSPRKRFIRELGDQILAFAKQQETEKLGERFSCMPLRDILAVRAYVSESGSYSLLVDMLMQGLAHARPRVRYNCAVAMDHLADERCTEPLRRLLHDPVPRVRRAALHSLSCDACKLAPLPANDDFVAILIELALADPSIRVRRSAAGELGGDCYDARAVAALETLLARESDPVLLRNARRALQHQESFAAGSPTQQR